MKKNYRFRMASIWKSRTVCRRHDRMETDKRMPYIPSDRELDERMCWMLSFFVDALVDDENEKDKLKDQIWTAFGAEE